MNKFLFCSIIILGLILSTTVDVVTKPDQPELGRTNAPGESNCSVNCHTGGSNPINNAGINFNFNGNNPAYTPGNSYAVIISNTDAGGVKFGFESTSLTIPPLNSAAGTFTVTNATTTGSGTFNSRNYIHHKDATSSNSWSFTWNAPATNVGDVVFYVASNAANGDNTNQGDNIYVDTFIVRAPVPPTADFTANTTTICQNQTVTFTDNSSNDVTGWNWNFGAGASPATANTEGPHTVTYSTSGQKNISLTVTAPNGNDTETKNNFVSVIPAPVAVISGITVICNGQSTTLTASGGGTYLWSNNSTATNITVSPTTNTTYIVTVTANGCTATEQVTVTVNDLPVVSFTVDDNAGCLPHIVSFTNTTPNSASCVWDFNDGNNLPVCSPPHSFVQAGSYNVQLTVTDNNNCTASAQQTITVFPFPNASAGSDVTICSGGSVQLTASVGTNYVWSTGATTQSITETPLSNATYIVTVTDGNGCTDVDTVSVNLSSSLLVSISNDTTICEGTAVQLFAGGGNTFTWSPASSLDNSQIPNPVAMPVDTTEYKVIIEDGVCMDSAYVTVNVNPNTIVATATPDTLICEGDSVQLSASGGTFYLWSPSAGLSNTGIANPVASPVDSIDYVVEVSDGICSGYDTVSVWVTPAIQAEISNDTTVILDDVLFTISLFASGGDTYLWQPSAGLSDSASANPELDFIPLTSGVDTTLTYIVSITKGACTEVLSVDITVDFVVGIVNAKADDMIKIYPNPASTELNFINEGNNEMHKVEIYNLTGIKVMELKTTNEKHQTINVSDLSEGNYLLRFLFATEAVHRMIQVK